jgi:hypothetical protein
MGVIKISKVLIASALKFAMKPLRLQKNNYLLHEETKRINFLFFIGVVDMRGSPPSPHFGI